MPPPINQSLESWFNTYEAKIYPYINKRDQISFVGHSLGPLFTLHVVNKFNLKLESAIFVAPFLEKLNKSWQIDNANSSFYKNDFDFKKLKNLIPDSYSLFSENDPYVDEKYSLSFAEKMNSKIIKIKGAKHLNSEIGLLDFSLVFELCKTRIDYSSISSTS